MLPAPNPDPQTLRGISDPGILISLGCSHGIGKQVINNVLHGKRSKVSLEKFQRPTESFIKQNNKQMKSTLPLKKIQLYHKNLSSSDR